MFQTFGAIDAINQDHLWIYLLLLTQRERCRFIDFIATSHAVPIFRRLNQLQRVSSSTSGEVQASSGFPTQTPEGLASSHTRARINAQIVARSNSHSQAGLPNIHSQAGLTTTACSGNLSRRSWNNNVINADGCCVCCNHPLNRRREDYSSSEETNSGFRLSEGRNGFKNNWRQSLHVVTGNRHDGHRLKPDALARSEANSCNRWSGRPRSHNYTEESGHRFPEKHSMKKLTEEEVLILSTGSRRRPVAKAKEKRLQEIARHLDAQLDGASIAKKWNAQGTRTEAQSSTIWME